MKIVISINLHVILTGAQIHTALLMLKQFQMKHDRSQKRNRHTKR